MMESSEDQFTSSRTWHWGSLPVSSSMGAAYVGTQDAVSHRVWVWDFSDRNSTSNKISLVFSLLWSTWMLARIALWTGIVFSSLLRFWSEIIHLWMGGYKNLPHAYENWTWKILIAITFAFTERAVAMGRRTCSLLPPFLSFCLFFFLKWTPWSVLSSDICLRGAN